MISIFHVGGFPNCSVAFQYSFTFNSKAFRSIKYFPCVGDTVIIEGPVILLGDSQMSIFMSFLLCVSPS